MQTEPWTHYRCIPSEHNVQFFWENMGNSTIFPQLGFTIIENGLETFLQKKISNNTQNTKFCFTKLFLEKRCLKRIKCNFLVILYILTAVMQQQRQRTYSVHAHTHSYTTHCVDVKLLLDWGTKTRDVKSGGDFKQQLFSRLV